MKQRTIIAAGLILQLAACTSIIPGSARKEIDDQLSRRTGYRLESEAADRCATNTAITRLLEEPLNADRAVQLALVNNAEFQAVAAQLGIAEADRIAAATLSNPEFSGAFRMTKSGPNVEFSLVENIISLLDRGLRQQIAAAQLEAAKVEVTERLLSLMYQVRHSFLRYQGAMQLLAGEQANLAAAEAAGELSSGLVRAGNRDAMSAVLDQLNTESVRLAVAHLEDEASLERGRLLMLLGTLPDDPPLRVEELPKPPVTNIDGADIERQAVEESFQLAAARWKLDALRGEERRTQRFSIFGELPFGASASREPEGIWGIGPAVTVPIPFFDFGTARRLYAAASLEKERQEAAALEQKVRINVRALCQRYRIAEIRLERYDSTILGLANRLVAEAEKRHNAMLASPFDLLAAKQRQLSLRSERIAALRDYWLRRVELEAAGSGLLFPFADTTPERQSDTQE